MHISNYDERVRRVLARKKRAIFKRGLNDAKKEAGLAGMNFIHDFQEALIDINKSQMKLINDVAETLINNTLCTDPTTIVNMTKNVLKHVTEYTDVELTLHPVDVAHLRSYLEQHQSIGETTRKLTILEDSSFPRGSIVIKANKSIVDAHVNTQIEHARELIGFEIGHGSIR